MNDPLNDEVAGYRAVPHTADLRIEAWAPTRDRCIARAVLGTVSSFLDLSAARSEHTCRRRLSACGDEDVLVAVLDEMIYLLETTGEVPVDVALEAVDGGVDVVFAMTDARALQQTGAVPKAVSLHQLRLAPGPQGWQCAVTIDV
ncbi:MAG: archease [Rhodococcus sp. (in: high G+C Gram-positive bacteria)]|uniref:archease n=1 Tax=Rhodococcus sp. TaxID=1831 RepID=UPI003BB1E6FE